MEALFAAQPKLKLLSKGKLLAAIAGEGIPRKEVDAYFAKRETYQVNQKPQYTPQLKITAPPDSYQIDIMHHLPEHRTANGNTHKVLLLIEIPSRKAFAYPLKSGSVPDVLNALEAFLKETKVWGRPPRALHGDDFFSAKGVADFCARHSIGLRTDVAAEDHLTPGGGNVLGIVDRFTRTLKGLINRWMLAEGSRKWVAKLDDLVEAYNDTVHTSLKGFTPDEVFADDEFSQKMHEGRAQHNEREMDGVDLQVGDRVRLMQGKRVFDKEKARFGTTVHTIQEAVGNRFRIEGVKRLYRPGELFKVTALEERAKPQSLKVIADAVVKEKRAAKLRRAEPGIDAANVLGARQKRGRKAGLR